MPYSTIVREESKALRRKGFSLNEISEKLDISKSTIHDWVSNSIHLSKKAAARINNRVKNGCKNGNRSKYQGKFKGKYSIIVRRPNGWSRKLIKLIAHLMFDGGRRKDGYTYYNSNIVLINQIERLVREIFQLEPHRRIDNNGTIRTTFFSADFSRYIRSKTPKLLEYLPKARVEEKRAFLRSFFDDEGNASFDKKYGRHRVRGYQNDRKTLVLVQKLLADFKIRSLIGKNELVISRKADIAQFKKEINFSPRLYLNPNRKNSIWKRKITKRKILNMILAKSSNP